MFDDESEAADRVLVVAGSALLQNLVIESTIVQGRILHS